MANEDVVHLTIKQSAFVCLTKSLEEAKKTVQMKGVVHGSFQPSLMNDITNSIGIIRSAKKGE